MTLLSRSRCHHFKGWCPLVAVVLTSAVMRSVHVPKVRLPMSLCFSELLRDASCSSATALVGACASASCFAMPSSSVMLLGRCGAFPLAGEPLLDAIGGYALELLGVRLCLRSIALQLLLIRSAGRFRSTPGGACTVSTTCPVGAVSSLAAVSGTPPTRSSVRRSRRRGAPDARTSLSAAHGCCCPLSFLLPLLRTRNGSFPCGARSGARSGADARSCSSRLAATAVE